MRVLHTELAAGASPDFDEMVARLSPQLPLLDSLRETPQDPEWHGEGDVHVHTAWVVREAYAGLSLRAEELEQRRATLLLGAALHDIAKPLTTREAERDGRTRIIAPRHADRGRSYLAGRGVTGPVLDLVGHHHDPRQLVTRDAPARAYRRLARLCDTELLHALAVADMSGRECADKDERLEELELFRMACEEYGCFGVDPYASWREVLAEPGWSPAHQARALAQGIRDAEAGTIQGPHEALARGYALAAPRAELTILCGPSGAGKSTWCVEHMPDVPRVSLDGIRAQLTGDAADQRQNGQVRQEATRRLRQHLAAGESVIYDATSLRRDFRRPLVGLARDYGAGASIVVFAVPEETSQARNAARDRQVPAHILSRQYATWEVPYADEADALRWVV